MQSSFCLSVYGPAESPRCEFRGAGHDACHCLLLLLLEGPNNRGALRARVEKKNKPPGMTFRKPSPKRMKTLVKRTSSVGRRVHRSSAYVKNDAACGWVRLMGEDAHQSSSNELTWEGLQASCQLCARHKESYELSKARRACSVEGCEKAAQTLRGGVRLCRFHASKEEKPPTTRNAPGPGRIRASGPTDSEHKRTSSRGTDRARPHSQDATPRRQAPPSQLEARGISSPPRLDHAAAPRLEASAEMQAVEDRVLQGLTWEEIASIPDEDLRKRAVLQKKATVTHESEQLPPGTPEPPVEPALYAYLDLCMQGNSHGTALSQASTGRWSYSEGARRLREAARKHWSQLPNDSPPSIHQYVWELAQSGVERPVSGEETGRGTGEPQHPWIPHNSASVLGQLTGGTEPVARFGPRYLHQRFWTTYGCNEPVARFGPRNACPKFGGT